MCYGCRGCGKCGKTNIVSGFSADGKRKCFVCGTKVEDAKATKCPACKAPLAPLPLAPLPFSSEQLDASKQQVN